MLTALTSQALPTNSILDKLSTMFAGSESCNSKQLERDTAAILTSFRTLSGEENGDGEGMTDRDPEFNSNLILTSDLRYADALNNNEEPPIHLVLPVEGKTTMCNAVNGNNGHKTMTAAGVESVQPQYNRNHLNLLEGFVKGGESEQTAALNGHSRTASYISIEIETAETTNRPEQGDEQEDLIHDELGGHVCIHHEDTPEEWTLTEEESVAERIADGCTQPRRPHLPDCLANTHFQSTHNIDDAEEDKQGEPKGRDLLSDEDEDICKSLPDPMSGVLTPLNGCTEQATFEPSSLWPSPNRPSDDYEDTEPNLTGIEWNDEEVVTPAAWASNTNEEKLLDCCPNTTHEDDNEIITDVAQDKEKGDVLTDTNDASAGWTSDLCELVSHESVEAPRVASSSPAFPTGGPPTRDPPPPPPGLPSHPAPLQTNPSSSRPSSAASEC